MAYREPGVYLELINARPNLSTTPSMVPVIVGVGPKFMDHVMVPITRGSELFDTLPATIVTSILAVYTDKNGTQVNPSLYSLTGQNNITWGGTTEDRPEEGTTYYVTFEARPEKRQYQRAFITNFNELDQAYGGMFTKDVSEGNYTEINKIYLGAYLALESGASGIYVVQVEPEDKTTYNVVEATDFQRALSDVVSLIEDGYQIVPLTQNNSVINAVITHLGVMSSIEERKERVAFIPKTLGVPANGINFTSTEIEGFIDSVKTIQNKRVVVPFVSMVTKTLSDGVEYGLGAEFFCAALAGLDGILPAHRSLTRQRIFNFNTLKYVTSLTLSVKNKIAETGIVILEQSTPGSPIVIRHGLTTKVDNVQDREYSVVKVKDLTSKLLRNSLEDYIGVFNIDSFLISKVKGTIVSAMTVLQRDGTIIDWDRGSLVIVQDTVNPDALLVQVRVYVPYPCNHIDVTLVVE